MTQIRRKPALNRLRYRIKLTELRNGDPLPVYNDAVPYINPVDIFRSAITEELAKISVVDASIIYPALERTSTLDKGDLILAVPRLRVKGPPAEIASDWAAVFSPSALIKPPVATGTFLRFDYNPENLPKIVLTLILKLGPRYGLDDRSSLVSSSSTAVARKKTVIEFSSPNIAKQFHAGHLRSTIIGGFLANLYEGAGWETIRMNYLGDWGRQYGLLAKAFDADPIGHLFDIYVKISADFQPEEDEFKAAGKRVEDTAVLESQGLLGEAKAYFKRMEDGDEEALALWGKFREISIEKYKKTYARLNIHFTDYSGESTKGIAVQDNGAVLIDFAKYSAKNLVMSEQEAHLQRLFKILDLMGGEYSKLSKKMQHVTFGKVMGMSTRRGTVKFLDDILNDVGEAMHAVMRHNEAKYQQVDDPDKVADTLGISAVMVQDMSGKRINNYPFNLERMTSFEGDTGPYLQYAHARLCSIQRKAGLTRDQLLQADFSLLSEPHAVDLVRILAQYPDVVGHTFKTLEPTTILTYLFRLTHQLSSSYDILRVIGAPEGMATTIARAALYEAARQTIYCGMTLLGLSPVER
ncbi:arginyl-tRNA synthetase [Xylogone sp. PMI_703]|nr:arginyl-tRNA synthetase [Xylogone sp. PMI_703]